MKLRQVTPVNGFVEPIEIDELRQHLRLEHNEEDSYLNLLIPAARSTAEQFIDGIIASREFEYLLDNFTDCIELPLRPIAIDSISITYTDDNGDSQTVTSFDTLSTAYSVFVKPDYGELWPSIETGKDKVTIRFEAGFSEVPPDIKHAILMLAGTLYDQREDHTAGVELKTVPTSSQLLLNPYRKVSV